MRCDLMDSAAAPGQDWPHQLAPEIGGLTSYGLWGCPSTLDRSLLPRSKRAQDQHIDVTGRWGRPCERTLLTLSFLCHSEVDEM